MKKNKTGKFKLETPHTYAILMLIIVISWLLTYIIPAGEYAREKKNGQTIVIPGTYHTVSSIYLELSQKD